MQQNATFTQWSAEEVDAKLKDIMANCFKQCYETSKTFTTGDNIPSLVDGANIAGFLRVADAMQAQGDWW